MSSLNSREVVSTKKENNRIDNNEKSKKVSKNNKIVSFILSVIMCFQPLVKASFDSEIHVKPASDNMVGSNLNVLNKPIKNESDVESDVEFEDSVLFSNPISCFSIVLLGFVAVVGLFYGIKKRFEANSRAIGLKGKIEKEKEYEPRINNLEPKPKSNFEEELEPEVHNSEKKPEDESVCNDNVLKEMEEIGKVFWEKNPFIKKEIKFYSEKPYFTLDLGEEVYSSWLGLKFGIPRFKNLNPEGNGFSDELKEILGEPEVKEFVVNEDKLGNASHEELRKEISEYSIFILDLARKKENISVKNCYCTMIFPNVSSGDMYCCAYHALRENHVDFRLVNIYFVYTLKNGEKVYFLVPQELLDKGFIKIA
ncbi:MAG: hypothetical protein CfP315_0754 [Candidatus Improbicoccus pseudotrichonymphae]|uniref:Uncharacterized protein n=1 Tax=Candidatus Improbicoccus pseudotrichonymphae TaxID=3033792 RepID=A0AA48HVG5_9FIRM|nr:MAG: hypothetical protein CfP315_0754 [Candidatus Improbicoccus pseudotrichonymphae]